MHVEISSSPFLNSFHELLPFNLSLAQNYRFRLFADSGRHPHFGALHVEKTLPLTMQLETCLFERSLVVWKTTEILPGLFPGSGISREECSTVLVPFKTDLAISQNREQLDLEHSHTHFAISMGTQPNTSWKIL